MKIVAPLSNSDFYEYLMEAGADEFYCGYVPSFWLKKYGMAIPLNRREYFDGSNIYSQVTMKLLAKKMQRYKIPIKITFNEISYPSFLYPEIRNIILELMDCGFSSFIISDFGLLLYLRENKVNCHIHLSGESLVINREAMAFFDAFDISRYIFPRKTPINDIRECIASHKDKDCTYEAFMLNANCRYVGGFCNSLHCDELVSLCFVPSELKTIAKNPKTTHVIRYLDLNQKRQNYIFNRVPDDQKKGGTYELGAHGCGLCQIKALMDAGVSHLKIVGRGTGKEMIRQDIINLKKAICIAQNVENAKEFENKIKVDFFNQHCPEQFCYYP